MCGSGALISPSGCDTLAGMVFSTGCLITLGLEDCRTEGFGCLGCCCCC